MNESTGLLITGARVYTADPRNPWAEAVVTRGNTIVYVGDEAGARAQAGVGVETLHVPGGLVVPGLNESHVHMTGGSEVLPLLNLDGVVELPELQARLRAYADEHPDEAWIEGYALGYEPFQGLALAPREALDAAVADRPIFLHAFDFHSAWCNSLALRLAGIERGATIPLPNEVVVDGTGQATGMLKERLAIGHIERLFPEPDDDAKDEKMRRAMQYMNSQGITSVQNMDGDPQRLAQYERLHSRGHLTVRGYHYMSMRETTPRERLHEFAELTRRYADGWNRTRGIKLFIDGVVESKTALLLEPYADGSGDTGVPDMDPQAYHEIVVQADSLNMDVATHAIGDRGVRLALDAYEAAQHANGGRRARRHRVEHIEVIHPDDIARFGRLGVTASMQPFHAAPTGDPRTTPWTRLVGPAREPYAFVWRRLLETGATLAFGSDWPVVTPDVRVGLHTALTRTSRAGEPAGGWQTQLCVTLAQALDAYTRGGAYAESQEQFKGMLRPGLWADVTIFARDLFTVAPAEITSVAVAATIVDGQVVYRGT